MTDVHVRTVETAAEMDASRALRVRVFVREQGWPLEAEFDEHDAGALHAVAVLRGSVVGTGRLYRLPSGETRIGRMAVEAAHRRQGIGELILSFLEEHARRAGVPQVALHAQTYVCPFYERHGYVADGEPFLEWAVQHVRMVKQLR